MTAERVCDLAPFLSPVVAQVRSLEDAGSALEILTQTLESYLAAFRSAVCEDLTQIVEECCEVIPPVEISFLELTDTPDSYTGAGGQAVAVKVTEDGLEFVDFPQTPDAPSFERMSFCSIQLGTAAAVTSTTNYLGYGNAVGVNGTLQFGAIAAGSVKGSTPRRQIVSGGGAGSTASIKTGTASWFRGSTSAAGGFRFATYFGTSSAVAQQRAFVGMAVNAGIIGNVQPNSLVNCFGFGYDSAGTSWNVMHNDNAGTAISLPLGASFPVNTTDWFFFEIIAEPNASSIEYRVVNVTTGAEASGSINTELPVNTTFLNAHLWCNNGTTAQAVTMDFTVFLLEMRQ